MQCVTTLDGRGSVLDGVDIQMVTSGTNRISETATDVIAGEGSTEVVSTTGVSAFVAWLFEEDAEPGPSDPRRTPGARRG